MKILVACEESQRVCKEFRKLGHEAYSCDIEECSGGHPEWHIQGDVLKILNPQWSWDELHNDYLLPSDEPGRKVIQFETADKLWHEVDKWDMIIAFPPCTHLAVSGASWFQKKREDGRQREAIEFFMKMINADCDKVAVENPVNIISGDYIKKYFPDLCVKYALPIKPTQRIQPYEFGDHARKKTCLWTKGLPKLKPTDIVDPGEIMTGGFSKGACANWATDKNGKILAWNDPETAKQRSKTFPGIAKAMAEQWGGGCLNE